MSKLFQDHYSILGLEVINDPSEITLKQINHAYRKYAKKYHPDKVKKSESFLNENRHQEKFETVSKAVELLRDDVKRQAYDELYRAKKREEKRLAAEDQRTKIMRFELEQNEKEGERRRQTNAQTRSAEQVVEHIRRDNINFTLGTARTPSPQQQIKIFTFEEHLKREQEILAAAMKMGDL